ncbi:hypothetical protein NW755_002528 [Fusarium falciforme]|uniref:Uncharacterized protein n=1 Tax=Fusarium falciforme TaxID=195108 RepID=A0A9W8V3W0_9HYPO|nr:hypothetical protein NW755_002528 [Fusarium falciforme]
MARRGSVRSGSKGVMFCGRWMPGQGLEGEDEEEERRRGKGNRKCPSGIGGETLVSLMRLRRVDVGNGREQEGRPAMDLMFVAAERLVEALQGIAQHSTAHRTN